MTKLGNPASGAAGIVLDPNSPSPYDLPSALQVEAQDPPEDVPFEDTPPEDTEETGPSEEEMLTEVENSPGVQWKKYLRPILKIIKDTILKVPIELHNSYTVGLDEDTTLGFHIVGTVHFLEDVPADVAAQLQGTILRYDAFITSDGNIGDVDLVYPTEETPYKPTYRINRNVERL